MAYVRYPDDAVTTRRITVGDIYILDARSHVKSAEKARVMQYVRIELKRIIKSTTPFGDEAEIKKYIARSEKMKSDLAKGDADYVKSCKDMVKSLIVDATLSCRAKNGEYNYTEMVRRHLRPAFENVYGKVFD